MLIDEEMVKNNEALESRAKERDAILREIANWVHPSVPVSKDEVRKLNCEIFDLFIIKLFVLIRMQIIGLRELLAM